MLAILTTCSTAVFASSDLSTKTLTEIAQDCTCNRGANVSKSAFGVYVFDGKAYCREYFFAGTCCRSRYLPKP